MWKIPKLDTINRKIMHLINYSKVRKNGKRKQAARELKREYGVETPEELEEKIKKRKIASRGENSSGTGPDT